MAELESGLSRVNDNVYALAQVDELSEAEKYIRFGLLPAAITNQLTAEQIATLDRLGPYAYNDTTREDLQSQNYCTVTEEGDVFLGQCKNGTTDVREGRGA